MDMDKKQPVIFLDTPAAEWETAFPIGAGSIGAMIFGTPGRETLQLNEEAIWSGEKHTVEDCDFRERLDKVRELLVNGHPAQADKTATEQLMEYCERIDSYETAGELYVDTGCVEFSDYRRELLLDDGVCRVSYVSGGVKYERESFASYPAKLLAFKFTSDKPADYKIAYERECSLVKTYSASGVSFTGITEKGSHKFAVKVKLETDGKVSADSGGITVSGAKFITLTASLASEFLHGEKFADVCASLLDSGKNYCELYDEAVADHRALMTRSSVTFEGDPALDALPVSARLKRLREDENAADPALYALYFEFGKYLLVGSSRPGTLPANLQGVWNKAMNAPWNADYHTNINLQMNYWNAEETNLSECTLPLFDYINNYLLEPGVETAKKYYKVDGAVLHHLSDIYGFAKPADGLWGLWPIGGAWLCYHLWEHWLYTNDRDYLKDTAYSYIRECAKFFINYMYFDEKTGVYMTGPSTSPENRYFTGDKENETAYLCMSPTMDVEMITGLLKMYIECENELGIDADTACRAADVLSKMPSLKVGKHGQLMEWIRDYDEPEPGHRHISHAFALYPDCAINPDTPELFAAIRTTLERRLASGGGHTGWSRAWLINLFARLLDGNEAYRHMRLLMCKSTKENLFDIHPPFQIDGNFGGSAGIAETLLQSQNGVIAVLPALGDVVKTGEFNGLCARGGVEVSAKWQNKKLTSLTLKRIHGADGAVKVKLPEANGGGTVKVYVTGEPAAVKL